MNTRPSGALLLRRAAVTLVAGAILSAPVGAQQYGGTTPQPTPQPVLKNLTLLGIPSGTVAPGGLVFGTISGTTRRDDGNDDADDIDGSLSFGLGLGSAEKTIGVQLTGYVTSLTDDFGDSGYLEVKASRRLSAGATPTYVSLTLGTLGGWGDSDRLDASATLALSTFAETRFSPGGPSFPVMFTLGAGSHLRNSNTDPGIFAGVGIGLTENFGASVAWSGEYVTLGTSFRAASLPNLALTAAVYDVFDQEDSRRLTVSVSYFLKDLF